MRFWRTHWSSLSRRFDLEHEVVTCSTHWFLCSIYWRVVHAASCLIISPCQNFLMFRARFHNTIPSRCMLYELQDRFRLFFFCHCSFESACAQQGGHQKNIYHTKSVLICIYLYAGRLSSESADFDVNFVRACLSSMDNR